MKHKNLKKRLLALATTVMTLAMCMVTAMPAMAANQSVNGGTTTFDKYLVMDQEANVPNVEFEFSIAAGDAVPATGTAPAIDKGIGNPTVGSATFAPTNQTYTTAQPGDTVTLSATQKYAVQTVTVDFSSVSFTAPGIYRYTITETANGQDGITNDTSNTRTLDVYVVYQDNSGTNQLEVKGYVLQDGVVANPTTKSTGFTNTYTTNNLTLEKQVTGNQGDRDKYFKFTVTISNADEGTVYDVTLPVDSHSDNSNELTVGQGGTVTATYYLKDDQSVVIQGLTANTKYTITEDDYSTDGYTTTNDVNAADGTTTGEKTMGANNQKVTFTNDKSGTVPTGILLETAPYVVLMLVVVAGGVALLAAKRKHSR